MYANIWGILMGSMSPYIAYMDPMGMGKSLKISKAESQTDVEKIYVQYCEKYES